MADVPRDPRQLARDILAGKISIEELAREQARRAGGGVQPQVRVPDRVPLPRPAPVQQPAPRPVLQPMPPVQPVPQRPVPPPSPRPPVVIKPPPPRKPVQQPVKPVVTAPPVRPAKVETPVVSKPTSETTGTSGVVGAKLEIGKIMKNRTALRQCIVMAEVLGTPVALREE